MKIKSEIVSAKHTDLIRAVKDLDTFGGPNMWNLEVKTHDGFYDRVQWMHVSNVERIIGHTLTRYPEDR